MDFLFIFGIFGLGPICVAGLTASGMETKKSIGTTLMSEGIVCLVSLILVVMYGIQIDIAFLIPLVVGSSCGSILGSMRTQNSKCRNFSKIVGLFILFLGVFTILKEVLLG